MFGLRTRALRHYQRHFQYVSESTYQPTDGYIAWMTTYLFKALGASKLLWHPKG